MASSLHKHTEEELHLVSLRSHQQRMRQIYFTNPLKIMNNPWWVTKNKKSKNTGNTIRFHHTDPTDDCDNFIETVPDRRNLVLKRFSRSLVCKVATMQTLVPDDVTSATCQGGFCFSVAKGEDESPTLIYLNPDLRVEPL